uniref:Uncharacterized protein n=1 Tax=Junco hyemalis TaxID=40217 RepID=A0A8C5NKI7_JUNHY
MSSELGFLTCFFLMVSMALGVGLTHWALEPRTPGLKPSCTLSFPQRWDYRHVPLHPTLINYVD